ncbi:hypothetical protein, partial [Halopseudomonas aestusnigri]|uniref:hypothetical protein n=1 Tax=Halopseudomonas aestusnigri TaxID=857252 RepID=UPI003002BEF3
MVWVSLQFERVLRQERSVTSDAVRCIKTSVRPDDAPPGSDVGRFSDVFFGSSRITGKVILDLHE